MTTPHQLPASGPETSSDASNRQFAIGLFAGLGAMTCFGSWPVFTRLGTLTLDLPVIVLIRFLVPAIFFLPVILRVGLVPRGVPRRTLAVVIAGSGVPFFLCAAAALVFAPVAEAAPLIPGTPPLFVALYMMAFERHRFRRIQVSGLVLIALGIAVVVGFRIFQSHAIVVGHFLALLAAAFWSAYTVAFRASGLAAVECSALVAAWSTFFALPFGALFLYDAWSAGLYSGLLAQFAMQGLGTGIVAIFLFGICIRNLGASEASAMVALGPVFSVALAVPLLGEVPEWPAVAGLVLTTAGAVFANWRAPRETPVASGPEAGVSEVTVQRLDPARWRSPDISAGGTSIHRE